MSPDEQCADTQPAPYYASEAPACFCASPTPWERRRYDGTWEGGSCEMRSCMECGASLTRLVAP